MGKLNKSLFSSKDQTWETPINFFNKLDSIFKFELDVAASDDNHKCDKYYTEEKEIEIAHNRTVLKERQNKEETKEMLKRLEGIGTRLVEIIVDKNRSGSVGSDYYWFSGKEMSYYPIV